MDESISVVHLGELAGIREGDPLEYVFAFVEVGRSGVVWEASSPVFARVYFDKLGDPVRHAIIEYVVEDGTELGDLRESKYGSADFANWRDVARRRLTERGVQL